MLRPGQVDEGDPIGRLDVSISSRLILDELSRRVDSGEMRMALALYPVSMQDIMDIADSGNIMPPKATWFEPKLRSGLVVHKLC